MGYEETISSILKLNKTLEIKWKYFSQILAHCIHENNPTNISQFLILTISTSISILNKAEYFQFIRLLFFNLRKNQKIQDIILSTIDQISENKSDQELLKKALIIPTENINILQPPCISEFNKRLYIISKLSRVLSQNPQIFKKWVDLIKPWINRNISISKINQQMESIIFKDSDPEGNKDNYQNQDIPTAKQFADNMLKMDTKYPKLLLGSGIDIPKLLTLYPLKIPFQKHNKSLTILTTYLEVIMSNMTTQHQLTTLCKGILDIIYKISKDSELLRTKNHWNYYFIIQNTIAKRELAFRNFIGGVGEWMLPTQSDDNIFSLIDNLLNFPLSDAITLILNRILVLSLFQQRFNLLLTIIEQQIGKLIRKLVIAGSQFNTLQLLRFLLLGYQISPKYFHIYAQNLLTIMEESGKLNVILEGCNLLQLLLKIFEESEGDWTEAGDVKSRLLVVREKYAIGELESEKMDSLIRGGSWMYIRKGLERVRNAGTSTSTNTITNRNIRGLNNLGNTCYLNSIIQSLFHIKEFSHPLLSLQIKLVPSSPLFQTQRLFALLLKSNRTSIPTQIFKNSLPSPFKTSFGQQDASEFMKILLDLLERELTNPNTPNTPTNTLISGIFGGIMENRIICSRCNRVSIKEEKFIDFILSTEEHGREIISNGGELWDILLRPDILEGEDKYFCEECNECVDAHKSYYIKNLPPVLMLTISRFYFNQKVGRRYKKMGQLILPLEFMVPHRHFVGYNNNVDVGVGVDTLDPHPHPDPEADNLSEEETKDYMSEEESVPMETGSEGPLYELYGAVIHSGVSAHFGHYYSIMRESESDSDETPPNENPAVNTNTLPTSHWWVLNDANTFRVDLSFISSIYDKHPEDTPYIFIYKLNNLPTAPAPKLTPCIRKCLELDNSAYLKQSDRAPKYDIYKELNRFASDNTGAYNYRKFEDDEPGAGMGGGAPPAIF